MPRLLAIEWDASEARVAAGRTRGTELVLEQAFTVDFPRRSGDAAAPTEAEIGERIGKALSERGWSRGEALVAVGRASIELRFLTTPPVPPEELPDLVRLQAVRQFTTLGNDWPVDFVPLEQNKDGGTNVLAAAISPELVQQIQSTCTAAHVTCSRLVLRPFAAAALVKKLAVDGRCRLTIDFLGEEADLTVLAGERVVFPRTVRLPSGVSAEALAKALVSEVRRTVVAAQNQLGGRRVEQVVIFGDSAHHASLKSLMESELSLDGGVELLDPFSVVEKSDELNRHLPRNPGTFAPVLGMLLDEAAGNPPGIDFLHPRKRAQATDRRRILAIAGGAAAALILILMGIVFVQLWQLSSEIKSLEADLKKKEKDVKNGTAIRNEVAKVDKFVASDISWLDEIRQLSEKAPPPETTRVDKLGVTLQPAGGGKLSLEAVAASTDDVTKLEESIRDETHVPKNFGPKQDDKLKGLTWKFREEIEVAPVDPTAAASRSDLSPKSTAKGEREVASPSDAKTTGTKKAAAPGGRP